VGKHQSKVYGETEPRNIVNAILKRTGNGGEVMKPDDPFTREVLDRFISYTDKREYPQEYSWLTAIEPGD